MSRKDEIKRMWADVFGDSKEYVDMYFDRVYRDCDAMTLCTDGHVVSSLLLQPYAMTFHGHPTSASYIAGAATRRNMRGRGLMSALMADALDTSRACGDIITCLIPASGYLYRYYSRFGFATVALTDVMRYTSLHAFAPTEEESAGEFTPVDDLFDERVSNAVAAFERELPQATVLHSRRDYLNILDDLSLDGGLCAAVTDAVGDVAAIGWARPAPDGSGVIRVDEILYRTDAARLAVLRIMRAKWPDTPFAILAPVTSGGRCKPTKRGMARIVNAGKALGLIASDNPGLRLTLRVTDPLMPVNDGVYRLADGECIQSTDTEPEPKHLDFDIDIITLAELIFSSPEAGSITGLPAQRLRMALMLD